MNYLPYSLTADAVRSLRVGFLLPRRAVQIQAYPQGAQSPQALIRSVPLLRLRGREKGCSTPRSRPCPPQTRKQDRSVHEPTTAYPSKRRTPHTPWSSLLVRPPRSAFLLVYTCIQATRGTSATRQTRCCGCSTAIPSFPSRSGLRPPRGCTPVRSTPRVCARSRGASVGCRRGTPRPDAVASRSWQSRVTSARASVARAPSVHVRRRGRVTRPPCRRYRGRT